MNCPYCNSEMEKGFIQSGRPVFWAVKKRRIFFLPDNDLEVTSGFWNGCFATAFLCRNCKKIILDYEKSFL